MPEARPCIDVLAGTNGAGKSSIGGTFLRTAVGEYFNPDEFARRLRAIHPHLSLAEANALAWEQGRRGLASAIVERRSYFLETTLGGATITKLLGKACDVGLAVRIWYVGLETETLHVKRVAARVRRGGHDIPLADIQRRYRQSRLNLLTLLPRLTELVVYDNSHEADPAAGLQPIPRVVLHLREGTIVGPPDLASTPAWAKPIVAAALKYARR